eukprot:SAG25_NODE_4057_length_900_cov_0.694132_1_plen_190_part_10
MEIPQTDLRIYKTGNKDVPLPEKQLPIGWYMVHLPDMPLPSTKGVGHQPHQKAKLWKKAGARRSGAASPPPNEVGGWRSQQRELGYTMNLMVYEDIDEEDIDGSQVSLNSSMGDLTFATFAEDAWDCSYTRPLQHTCKQPMMKHFLVRMYKPKSSSASPKRSATPQQPGASAAPAGCPAPHQSVPNSVRA